MNEMKGQALAEAVIVLASLVLFFISATWLFRHIGYAHQLQAQASGRLFQAVYQAPHELNKRQDLEIKPSSMGQLSSAWRSSYSDLQLGATQLYGLQLTQSTHALQGMPDFIARLQRHAYWMGDTGTTNGDTQTRTRLEQAEEIWRQTAGPSQGVVRRLLPSFSALEGQWGRQVPHTDWLGPWERYVPHRKD